MIVYRLAAGPYKDDLSGTGAKIYGGRWNMPGYPAVYCAQHISLCILEILVRTGIHLLPTDYYMLSIDIPEKISLQKIQKTKLKKDWKTDIDYSQWMGTEFLKLSRFAVLEIPSAIIDDENNFLLNPLHPDFKKIKLISVEKFDFDKRLLIKHE